MYLIDFNNAYNPILRVQSRLYLPAAPATKLPRFRRRSRRNHGGRDSSLMRDVRFLPKFSAHPRPY